MVPHDHHRENSRLRKTHDPFTPFTLESRSRITVAVGIPGKDDQINPLLDRSFHDRIQSVQKIERAQRQAALRISSTLTDHVNMCVGEMQDFYH